MQDKQGGWIFFWQQFTFVLKYKARIENWVAYVLSIRSYLLATFAAHVVGMDTIKSIYKDDFDFRTIWHELSEGRIDHSTPYVIHHGCLVKSNCCA